MAGHDLMDAIDVAPGSFLKARSKTWFVDGRSAVGRTPVLDLVSIKDDSQGEAILLPLSPEVGAEVIDPQDWSKLLHTSFEGPERLGAYLRATEWRTPQGHLRQRDRVEPPHVVAPAQALRGQEREADLDHRRRPLVEGARTGLVYVLRSKSDKPEVAGLLKVGTTAGTVEDRIKGAEDEATYLYASVTIVDTYELIDHSAKEAERLLHRQLARHNVALGVTGRDGRSHKATEWFKTDPDTVADAIAACFGRRVRTIQR